VVQEGQVTFPIGDTTREVRGGEMVLAPANTPHKFMNSGEEPLHMIAIQVNRSSRNGLRGERLTRKSHGDRQACFIGPAILIVSYTMN